MRHRRADVAGRSYFFTVNLADLNRRLLVEHIDVLRTVMRTVKTAHPFHIDAMVIVPDHLYTLSTLPEDVADCAMRRMRPGFRSTCRSVTDELGGKHV